MNTPTPDAAELYTPEAGGDGRNTGSDRKRDGRLRRNPFRLGMFLKGAGEFHRNGFFGGESR